MSNGDGIRLSTLERSSIRIKRDRGTSTGSITIIFEQGKDLRKSIGIRISDTSFSNRSGKGIDHPRLKLIMRNTDLIGS
mgnify:CR=1 FL=1